MGTKAAASRRTSHPNSWASFIHSNGCWTPEKLDWAGKAKSLFLASGLPSKKLRSVAIDTRMSGGSTGTYRVLACPTRSKARIPTTELWLS